MTINAQIEHWLTTHKNTFTFENRPFVTLCYAQSWDGSITTRAGNKLALSGEESSTLTHQLRSLHDGILVGIGTVLADDPQLTVRNWNGSNPQPIVLDSRLRLPHSSQLCQRSTKKCWILTTKNDDGRFGDNTEIITLAADSNKRVDLPNALHFLRQKGIKTLMVEGGSDVITAFLKAQLADAIALTIAPNLVGGYKAVDNLGLTQKTQLPQIRPIHTQMLGEDLIMWGDLHYQEKINS